VFRDEVGAHIPTGLAVGINDTSGTAVRAVTSLVDSMLMSRVVDRQAYALGKTIGEQIGKGTQNAVKDAFANLPNVVKWGSVSEQMWNKLKAAGWKGKAGDGMEALYRPAARSSWNAPGTVYEDGSVRGGGSREPTDAESIAEAVARGLERARLRMHPDNSVTIKRLADRGAQNTGRR
jgi:hypothetical protein